MGSLGAPKFHSHFSHSVEGHHIRGWHLGHSSRDCLRSQQPRRGHLWNSGSQSIQHLSVSEIQGFAIEALLTSSSAVSYFTLALNIVCTGESSRVCSDLATCGDWLSVFTGLISFKIWNVRKNVSGARQGMDSFDRLIAVIVESGMCLIFCMYGPGIYRHCSCHIYQCVPVTYLSALGLHLNWNPLIKSSAHHSNRHQRNWKLR